MKKKIMLIDDNDSRRNKLKEALESNYKVVPITDFKTAIGEAEKLSEDIVGVIIDTLLREKIDTPPDQVSSKRVVRKLLFEKQFTYPIVVISMGRATDFEEEFGRFKNCSFHTVSGSPHDIVIKEIIAALNSSIDKENIKMQIKTAREEYFIIEGGYYVTRAESKEEKVSALSLLKHRIAHLWLPLDIDIQGIMECWNNGRKEDARIYLKQALESKGGDIQHYRRKLADLWFMVAKGKMEDGRWKIDGFEKQEGISKKQEFVPGAPRKKSEELLAHNQAIIDLINDEKRKNEKVKKYWKTLLKLCGLNFKENEPFKKGNKTEAEIYPQSSNFDIQDSSILKFMCYLDCLIQNQENITPNTVNELFQKEAELFKTLSEELKTLTPEPQIAQSELQMTDLHSWFCALDECVNNLRMEL